MSRPRVLLLALLGVMVLAATTVVTVVTGGEGTERAVADPPADRGSADRTSAVAVLRAWDRRRAAAWRTGDAQALTELYARGAAAGRADLAALAAYDARGLRVTGMRMQVAAVEVRSETEARIVAVVTDRLVGAVAVGHGRRVALPEDRWSRRRIRLLRTGESWVVAEVVDQRRPVASAESTSASENS